VDRIVHQIRRAEERDRLAAKQLADGKSLRGEPLTFDQTQQLTGCPREGRPADRIAAEEARADGRIRGRARRLEQGASRGS
jgi:hypothetical protein